jgi:hypothetical protein
MFDLFSLIHMLNVLFLVALSKKKISIFLYFAFITLHASKFMLLCNLDLFIPDLSKTVCNFI